MQRIPRFYERYGLSTRVRSRGTWQIEEDEVISRPTASPEPGEATPVVGLLGGKQPVGSSGAEGTGKVARRGAATAEPVPECRCGFGMGHHFIRPVPQFDFKGWVLIMIGVNPPPVAVEFTCALCAEVIYGTRDPDEIASLPW